MAAGRAQHPHRVEHGARPPCPRLPARARSIWPWEYAPGWQWYHIDDIRNLQRDMARRKGGRPVEGLGSFQDRADLDAEVELMLAEVLADLAERDVTTDAAVRAVKRWAKTIHNHPRTPQ